MSQSTSALVSGLVAAYGFEEGAGPTTADASGGGLTGSLNGPVWQRGKFGNALSFNGLSDSLTVPDGAALHLTTGMTLSAWVRPTSPLGGHPPLVTKGTSWPADYGLYARLDSGLPSALVFAGGEVSIAAGSSPLPVGVWTHLATTYDGSNLSFYVDGALTASEPLVQPLDTSTGGLRVGGNEVGGEYFAGLVDEVRIYDHALSPTELRSGMGSAVAPAGPSLPVVLGDSSVLPLADRANGNLMEAQQAFLAEPAAIQSLSLYVTNAVGGLRMGIYAADGTDGNPGTKLAETAELAASVGWNAADLSSPVVLQPGTYWLVYLPSDSDLGIRVAGVGRYVEFPFAYGPLPATYATPSDGGNFHWSFYASGVPVNSGGCTSGAAPLPAGTACSDGNPCNGAETCDGAGNCVVGTPVVCTALDQCHVAGTCDPSSGVCSNPAKPDGAACDDADLCTVTDSCVTGTCVGSNPVICPAPGPCHGQGTCSAESGFCTNPLQPDGTSCSDQDLCTSGDACRAGVCAGIPIAIGDDNPCTADSCDPAAGVVHASVRAGTSCADTTLCNGAELCDDAGHCQSGTPPSTDDADPCTLDGCDPTLGVTHSPLPNCGGTRLESRASLVGRVQTSTGAAVTNFTVQVFDAPPTGSASETPRSDVTVSVATDGTFRARLGQFPESTDDRAPAARVLVRVSGDSFFRLTREALLRPGDVVDLGPLIVLARDSKVTSIGPEGGTATDSQGLVEVQIPAGALSETQAVRITPVPTREQFPTPLPDVTVTMYGVMLEPEGLELAQAGTIRFSNYRSFPTGLTIPFGFVDERTGRWLHDGSGTWDGQRFRASIRHFSAHDLNAAAGGEWYAFVEKGSDPHKSNCDAQIGSSTSFATGALKQSVTLPAVTRGGRSQSLTLTYDSGLAASRSYAQPGTTTRLGRGMGGASSLRIPLSGLSVRLSCQSAGSGSGAGCGTGISCVGGTIPGGFISSTYQALGQQVSSREDLGQSEKSAAVSGTYIDLPLAADGSAPEPTFVKVDNTITLSNPLGLSLSGGSVSQCVANGGVFGIQAGSGAPAGIRTDPVPQIHSSRYELAYHRRGAPAGNGWGIAELHEAFVPPDRSRIDVVHGDGYRETFGVRAEARVVAHAGDGADILAPPICPRLRSS